MIFVNNSFTVHQSEPVRRLIVCTFCIETVSRSLFIYDTLVIEDISLLSVTHSLTVILNTDFYTIFSFISIDPDRTTYGSKFAGIVSNGIDHKKRQHFISFHHSRRRFDCELDTFQLKPHPSFLHNIE